MMGKTDRLFVDPRLHWDEGVLPMCHSYNILPTPVEHELETSVQKHSREINYALMMKTSESSLALVIITG